MNKYLHLELKVEISLGTTIKEALKEALDLANYLNITISFSFNGEERWAHPGKDIEELYKYFGIYHE